MRRQLLFGVLFLAGCSGAGPLTDTTEESPPVALVDEALGLQAIEDIRDGQEAFMATRRRYAQIIEELIDTRMIEARPPWADSGYTIRLRPTPAADGYSATATAPEGAGSRSFFVDDTGVIRWALGDAASAASPVLEENSDPAPDPAEPVE